MQYYFLTKYEILKKNFRMQKDPCKKNYKKDNSWLYNFIEIRTRGWTLGNFLILNLVSVLHLKGLFCKIGFKLGKNFLKPVQNPLNSWFNGCFAWVHSFILQNLWKEKNIEQSKAKSKTVEWNFVFFCQLLFGCWRERMFFFSAVSSKQCGVNDGNLSNNFSHFWWAWSF